MSLEIENLLLSKGIKPTANRILIAKYLINYDYPVSMTEIADDIETMDHSSIFRVLTRFVDSDLVHVIDDGSGSLKYEICKGEHGHSLNDIHVHFKCESCGKIFCMKSKHVPIVELPEGFSLTDINYVMKGVCDKCSPKR